MQRLVDDVLAATKESVKTITYESVNIIVRIINGISALLLAVLPGKATILEGIQGWELRPRFSGPRFPRWMENGVSSFNQFIYKLSVDSDDFSTVDYSSGEEEMDEYTGPPSPLSHTSRISRTNSFGRHNRRRICWLELMISWIFLPAKVFFYIPLHLFHLSYFRWVSSSDRSSSIKRAQMLKENIIHRTTDRRRGIIEDLHLAIEMFIESLFDAVQKAARSAFSPLEAVRLLWRWFSYDSTSSIDEHVPTTMEEIEVEPEWITSFHHSLNTDARTCQDVITELGYPYEAIHVITADGYVLLLERIPRRDARKAVYLQHGVLDSSMGWVSNGVVGSPAFAAYDQGYDVFLGNFRGLVSREHVNKNISSRQYWHYSINQHGTEDIPATIDKIYQVKTAELNLIQPDKETTSDHQPFKLCAISHSLGGAAMIMYVITRQIEQKPHRLSRLILLSPAGFHGDSNLVFTVAEHIFILLAPVLAPLIPAFYIPTRFFRMIFNKLARDFHNYPAVGGLVQTLMSYFVGGDSSNWIGVLGMPHYNMNDMPGVSFQVALHLAQMKRAGKFRMFDYGSKTLNMEIYGMPEPLDVGEYYEFIDVAVDLVAGKRDEVIRPSMVRKHFKLMRNSGVEVSYREFEYAHLDFTFSHHEELLAYVMSRLRLVEPTEEGEGSGRKGKGKGDTRLKRKGQVGKFLERNGTDCSIQAAFID